MEVLVSDTDLRQKLSLIKAFLFDWDGVFNAGFKYGSEGSPFSEADSMGINLLRYGYWLDKEGSLPPTGIITGQLNEIAAYFAKREHLDFCFRGFKNKHYAFRHFLESTGLKAQEVAYCFDDVLDLGIAGACGLRICIKQFPEGPFHVYLKDNNLADLISGVRGGEHAVRQAAEYLLFFQNLYEKVLEGRIAYSDSYRRYLEQRDAVNTVFIDKGK